MSYYYLTFNPDQMGVFPQGKSLTGPYNFNAPNSVWNAVGKNLLHNLWVPEGFEIQYRAKFSDRLCIAEISFPFLIISQKATDIFLSYDVLDPLVFKLKITKKDKTVDYNLFIVNTRQPEYIDFQSSGFAITKHLSKVIEPVTIESLEDLNQKQRNLEYPLSIRLSNLVLKTDAIQQDMFLLPGIGEANYIVSQRLKEHIERENLTGFGFKQI